MMLAECAIVGNLADSLRQQSLDDFRDLEVLESLAHCGKRANFSPKFSRGETSCSTFILEAESSQEHQRECKNLRNKSKPLANQKIHVTSKETDLKLQSTLPELLTKPKMKSTGLLNVDLKREMLSSSEEELSELYVKNKVCMHGNENIQYLMAPGCHFEARVKTDEQQSSGTGQHKDVIHRKRYKKPEEGKTRIVKKIKLSRPSLDLDKMQATRLRCDKKFVLKNGNIFAPVDAT